MQQTPLLPFAIDDIASALFHDNAALSTLTIQHKTPSLIECSLDVTDCDTDSIHVDYCNNELVISGQQILALSMGDNPPLSLSRAFRHAIPIPQVVPIQSIQSQLSDTELLLQIPLE